MRPSTGLSSKAGEARGMSGRQGFLIGDRRHHLVTIWVPSANHLRFS